MKKANNGELKQMRVYNVYIKPCAKLCCCLSVAGPTTKLFPMLRRCCSANLFMSLYNGSHDRVLLYVSARSDVNG